MEEALRKRMLSPEFYPHRPSRVREVQTHISHVFIAPPFVYKVKKPVDFGFLDFRSLGSRCYYSHQELILNRRFSPGLYLSVLPVTFDGTDYCLDGSGEQVEYVLKMRQFDENKTMKRLIERGELTSRHMEALAAHLAVLHARIPRAASDSAWGTPEAVTFDCEENFAQLAPFVGDFIDKSVYGQVKKGTLAFLRRHRSLLEFRRQAGYVKECHGDLHTEHIIFEGEEILIFDCIEFNKRFRFIDTISDLAFLVMELDFLDEAPRIDPLLNTYFTQTRGDKWGPLLLDFYACYRATVRAKVHAFTAGDPSVPGDQRRRSRSLSRQYLDLAERLIGRYDRPWLVVTMGFSGTGKTTVAQALTEKSGIAIFRSDVIRKATMGDWIKTSGVWNEGHYTPEARAQVYEKMFARAGDLLREGCSVCLDASFLEGSQRGRALALAEKYRANFLAIECVCDEKQVANYLKRRREEGKDPSDADFSIYLRQKAAFSGWDPIPVPRRFSMETTRGIPEEEISMLSAFLRDVST